MSKDNPTDLELLAMRAEGLADRSIGVHFDRTSTQEALGVTSIVPTSLAPALLATHDPGSHPREPIVDPTSDPPVLLECERRLTAAGWNVRRSGANLVYRVPLDVSFAPGATIEMVRSDRSTPSWLRRANPGNWEPVEWEELLDGELGPWVMATRDQRVVSITHAPTPLSERSVEVGAWTAPEFRGRGYAAAVTARWAEVLRPLGRVLFYSTSLDNVSSQRVAARLGLRLIGWQWLLRDRDAEDDGGVHPSSALRT